MDAFIKIPCTVAILTRNSAETLPRALESVKNFAEIIICDSSSNDETINIADSYGARVIQQDKEFLDTSGRIIDFAGVRNQTLNLSTQPWFLFLDSDEYISNDLELEIAKTTHMNISGAYLLSRRYILEGQEITCTTTYPNYSLRLFSKDSMEIFIKKVHERIKLKSGIIPEKLKGNLYVPVDTDIKKGRMKDDYYISLEIKQIGTLTFSRTVSITWWHLISSLKFLIKLFMNVLFCRGIRMPLAIELDRHRYNFVLIAAMWKEYIQATFFDDFFYSCLRLLWHPKNVAVILTYHSISNNKLPFTVTPAEFERQVLWLCRKQFTLVTLSDLAQMRKKKEIPRRTLCITFDDGYRDNYTEALPILLRHKIPATIFVTTSNLGSRRTVYESALEVLSVNELIALHSTGCIDIQPHTVTHPKFTKVDNNRIKKEIEESKKYLEDLLKKNCVHFAYPHGRYKSTAYPILEQTGILYAYTTECKLVRSNSFNLAIPRSVIDARTTFSQFKGIALFGRFSFKRLRS